MYYPPWQCFSTSGPQPSSGPYRSWSLSPNVSYFVLNPKLIHDYYKFYKKPILVAVIASGNNKIFQVYFQKLHEKDRIVLKKIW